MKQWQDQYEHPVSNQVPGTYRLLGKGQTYKRQFYYIRILLNIKFVKTSIWIKNRIRYIFLPMNFVSGRCYPFVYVRYEMLHVIPWRFVRYVSCTLLCGQRVFVKVDRASFFQIKGFTVSKYIKCFVKIKKYIQKNDVL